MSVRPLCALLLLLFSACLGVDEPEAALNACLEDANCPADSRCDRDHLLCVSAEVEALEIFYEVIPPSESGADAPSWTTAPQTIASALQAPFVLAQPEGIQALGTVRWEGTRVPAELIFRPVDSTSELALSAQRVTTFSEVTRVSELEVDFATRLASDRDYQLEVRPSAQLIPGSEIPWLRMLPPLYLPLTEVLAAARMSETRSVLLKIAYPSVNTTCRPVSGRCQFGGHVISEEGVGEAGLQVRAIDQATGRTVSSTALTSEDGSFALMTSPSAEGFFLRVTGGDDRPLFPTIDLELSDPSEPIELIVPQPRVVTYSGSVEDSQGAPVGGANLMFVTSEVFDAQRGIQGSFQARTQADAQGRFSIELLEAPYEVVVSPGDGMLAVTRMDIRVARPAEGGPVQGQLFVVSERARLRGSVLTSSGTAIEEVSVEAIALSSVGDSSTLTSYSRSSSTVTNEEGAFDLRLDVGVYDIVLKPAAQTGFAWLVLPAQEVGSLDVTLTHPFEVMPPVVMEGQVVDSAGAALPRAQVRVHARTGRTGRAIEIARGETDLEGRCTLLVSPRILSSL